jgi:hypothetical protein
MLAASECEVGAVSEEVRRKTSRSALIGRSSELFAVDPPLALRLEAPLGLHFHVVMNGRLAIGAPGLVS